MLVINAHARDLIVAVRSDVTSGNSQDGRVIAGDGKNASASVESRLGEPIFVSKAALQGCGLRVSEAAQHDQKTLRKKIPF